MKREEIIRQELEDRIMRIANYFIISNKIVTNKIITYFCTTKILTKIWRISLLYLELPHRATILPTGRKRRNAYC